MYTAKLQLTKVTIHELNYFKMGNDQFKQVKQLIKFKFLINLCELLLSLAQLSPSLFWYEISINSWLRIYSFGYHLPTCSVHSIETVGNATNSEDIVKEGREDEKTEVANFYEVCTISNVITLPNETAIMHAKKQKMLPPSEN